MGFDVLWTERLAVVEAGIGRFGILGHHSPEGILDDDRRVCPHADLQEERMKPRVLIEKRRIRRRRPMPALILHEGVVGA